MASNYMPDVGSVGVGTTECQAGPETLYDRKSQPVPFREGERVFLFTPAEKTGEARRFARPFQGPYCAVEIDCQDQPCGST